MLRHDGTVLTWCLHKCYTWKMSFTGIQCCTRYTQLLLKSIRYQDNYRACPYQISEHMEWKTHWERPNKSKQNRLMRKKLNCNKALMSWSPWQVGDNMSDGQNRTAAGRSRNRWPEYTSGAIRKVFIWMSDISNQVSDVSNQMSVTAVTDIMNITNNTKTPQWPMQSSHSMQSLTS